MSQQTGQFRSAAFGGFHRQDVLDYLEKITQERQELETQLAQAEEGRAQAETRLAQSKEQAGNAQKAQAAMESELEYLRSELEQRSAALAQAEEDLKVLRTQVEALRPGAESWQRIKEQAGNIELSAHERAQVTIQDAHAQAAEIQAEGVRWVLDIQACCDKLQADMHSSIRSAELELDAARDAFTRAETDMEGFQQSLSDLLSGVQAEPEKEGPEAVEEPVETVPVLK